MGRPQVTITDDGPLVNDMRTRPAQPQPGGAPGAMAGSMPNRVMPLPAAGWQSYSPVTSPSLSTTLPKVNNGVPKPVPPQAPPVLPRANRAKPGALIGANAKNKTAAVVPPPSNPNEVKTYSNAYKRYGNPDLAGTSYSEDTGRTSTSDVKGNVLHWRAQH